MEGTYIRYAYNDGHLKRIISHDDREDWTEEALMEHFKYNGHPITRISFIAPGIDEFRRDSELADKVEEIFRKRKFRRQIQIDETNIKNLN